MNIQDALEKDIITAMKARDEHRLTTLRMVKSALRSKEIDKRQPLTDAETLQILTTLIKQRKDSIEQFTKGGRPELAEKEAVEVTYIEAYMPQSASEDRIRELVNGAVAQLAANNRGVKPGPKDMGAAMKVVQQHIAASGLRADGKLVSELVKAALAG